jgi:hypothetical protein
MYSRHAQAMKKDFMGQIKECITVINKEKDATASELIDALHDKRLNDEQKDALINAYRGLRADVRVLEKFTETVSKI